MKAMFKPLGLATAVAAVTAGYAGVASAQSYTERSVGNLGDLAIIPYYTVQDNWVTGVHITNTSSRTQVVKLRLRRATDSMDAMDFNLILSPYDVWTGFLSDDSGNVVFATDDNSCTAPLRADGRFEMPFIFRTGAEEGYIEVISMGSPEDEDEAIAVAAKHGSDGVPFDCVSVESNFFANGSWSKKGVYDSETTYQAVSDAEDYSDSDCDDDEGATICENDYVDSDNTLKVSYFMRDAASGTEFGGNAVHISDFSPFQPWMSNQETGLFSGDIFGFDYPDLNGGVLGYGDARGLFNVLRQENILGVSEVLNDWSVNPGLNVQTDWVVTMPGQYTMFDYYVYAAVAGFNVANCGKLDNPTTAIDDGTAQCDFRDIPVEANLTLWDREEGQISPEEGGLTISPAPPGTVNKLIFPNEVNVVEWTDGTSEGFLDSAVAISIDASPLGIYGWASLSVTAQKKAATTGSPAVPSPTANSNGQAICEFVGPAGTPGGVAAVPSHTMRQGPTYTANGTVCQSAYGGIPIVGFAAWQRSFPANPDANYGRLIDQIGRASCRERV